MRKKIIAGNWKMNKTLTDGVELAQSIIDSVEEKPVDCEVIIFPPFILLHQLSELVQGTSVNIGAQNCHWEKSGAFTGEVAIDMLTDINCNYVLIGHSERRAYFAETNESVNKKIKSALAGGLKVIVCVGETLEEREKGITEQIVLEQVTKAFNGISMEEIENIVIAYEPVWAIGTGKTATPEQAEEVHVLIRNKIKELYNNETAENISILYGGSVNPGNVKDLMAKENIDGGLIGGASLKVADFDKLMRYNQS